MAEYPNWFASTPAQQNFTTFLEPLKGEPDLKFLQLGAYTGDATVWLLENVLTDKSSHLVDVDTWLGSDEPAHDELNFIEIFEFYKDRIAKHDNVQFYRMTTWEYLRFHPDDLVYDFIYIDADHTALITLLDAELSWDLLKSGGIMAFDDYEWKSGKGPNYDPGPGIDTFLVHHNTEFDVLHKGWQVWISKR
jgi:hypothetical protein